ncbi:chemotaxis protein CheW [Marinobacter bohaiensis]|uniref:chemotaxis protein CheW n=1 Tax=Marinobacter bohaiensis TaxID=2201898 RepID=UPI000DAE04D7|nr:chemotaxis protein CheW [Marinobacter bohaiensis]
MLKKRQEEAYADPTAALSHYLDDLLHVATSTAEDVEAPAETSVETQVETAVDTLTRVDTAVREVTPPPVESTAVQVAEESADKTAEKQAEREARRARVRAQVERIRARRAEAEQLKQAEAERVAEQVAYEAREQARLEAEQAQPEVQPEPAPAGRPDWADSAFECLIFKVAGLQLAVPLVLLGAIHRIESDLHQIPGRPRWFMGMLPSGDHNLRVVDTAEWVMSGRVPEGARDGYKFVIRLDQSEWGLACDEVAQSFTLRPDDVRWRSERSRRPWLAGTVVDHMCALLDVQAMTQLLSRAEQQQRLDLS